VEELNIFWIVAAVIIFGVWLWLRNLQNKIVDMHKDVSLLMQKIIFMRVETHADTVYAYNAMNHEFVCQGKDMDDLNVQFGLRYPGRRGVIVEPDKEEVK